MAEYIWKFYANFIFRYYIEKFDDYPKDRKAVIPFILWYYSAA